MNDVITQNQRAKQEMNSMYLKQTGAKAQKSVIDWFISGTLPFQILSAIFSAFGFYYDFVLGLGVVVAIVLGVVLGAFIEVSKHFAVKGAFSDMDFLSRSIMAGVATILMVIAITYHYKSLTNYRNISIKQDLQTQVNFEREQLLASNKNISELISNNNELAKVLSNGKKSDDYLATRSIISNNELMKQLTALKGSSYASEQLLKQSQETANTTSTTLLLLFITMEFFALFGVIGKFMLNRNTSKNVKEITTTMDKLNTLESNVILATETAMIDSTMERINRHLNNPPTLPRSTQNSQNQANDKKYSINKESASNPYFMGTLWQNGQNLTDLPKNTYSFFSNPYFSGALHRNDNTKKEEKEQNKTELNNDKNNVVDLLKFSHRENEIIKEMWENGRVKKGDKLVPKRLVKLALKDERLITHSEIDKLYAKLEEQGHIVFKNGYRALSEIENITKKSE